jgi:hypothetical protein
MSRFSTAALCVSMLALAGCSSASAPQNVAGVRAMYRSIGLDAGAGDFIDICRSYMDPALSAAVKRTNNDCSAASSTSRLERWAEKVRLSKVRAATRIAVSGQQALVYDAGKPERAVYVKGQWLLAEVPELARVGTGG